MSKLTYKELEMRIKELENAVAQCEQTKNNFKIERELFTKGPVTVFWCEWVDWENWPVKYISPNVTQFGYQPDDFISGKLLYKNIIHPDDIERVIGKVVESQYSGKDYVELDYRIIKADGKPSWIYDYTLLYRNEDGEITQMIVYILDITEYKKIEEALQESKENYKELADSIGDILYTMDNDLKFVYRNKAAEEFSGISSNDTIGKSPIDIFSNDKYTKITMSVHREVLKTQQPKSFVNEYEHYGKKYFLEYNVYPSKKGITVIIKDVTKRKKAEDALKKSEERYRNLFDNCIDAISIFTKDGKITDVNNSMLDMLGYSRKEMIGRNWEEFYEDADERKKLRNELQKNGYIRDFEIKLQKKDGTIIQCVSNTNIWKDERRNVTGYQGILHDITKRKRIEDELKRAQNDLETDVKK